MDSLLQASRKLGFLLDQNDVAGALRYLNGLTSVRFTALYRFDQEQLRNRFFFDRMNPDTASTEDTPLEASYCIYVRQNRGPFLVADSLRDERVRGHAKQPTVRSYCGVPLIDAQGWMYGSVCHFDFEPHPLQESDVLLLEEVAHLLSRDAQGMPDLRVRA
ncbi:MAG: GAF domain-containing protein [Ramlibacter sp.]